MSTLIFDRINLSTCMYLVVLSTVASSSTCRFELVVVDLPGAGAGPAQEDDNDINKMRGNTTSQSRNRRCEDRFIETCDNVDIYDREIRSELDTLRDSLAPSYASLAS